MASGAIKSFPFKASTGFVNKVDTELLPILRSGGKKVSRSSLIRELLSIMQAAKPYIDGQNIFDDESLKSELLNAIYEHYKQNIDNHNK